MGVGVTGVAVGTIVAAAVAVAIGVAVESSPPHARAKPAIEGAASGLEHASLVPSPKRDPPVWRSHQDVCHNTLGR